jgi:glycerophosphoryl diester phosphodiesterase
MRHDGTEASALPEGGGALTHSCIVAHKLGNVAAGNCRSYVAAFIDGVMNGMSDAWIGLWISRKGWLKVMTSRPVVCYAHRGARAYAPENTLLAFAMAFDIGADAIECDVALSSDRYPVVIHDATLDRTTNGGGPVHIRTLAELRSLDVGWIRHPPERIPLLEEVLELVKCRNGQINLEVKGSSLPESLATAETIHPLLEGLEDDFRGRIVVSSFEHSTIALLKERLPWLRIGVLYGSQWRDQDLIAPALTLGAEAIHPEVGLLTKEMVARAHQAQLRVNVWTANSWIRIRRLLRWGVDGIFSDYPERVVILRALLRSGESERSE